MVFVKKVVPVLFFFILAASNGFAFTPQLDGSLVSVTPSPLAGLGGELGMSIINAPLPGRNVWVGPRLGMQWASGDSQNRLDFQFGVEAVVWVMNAVGTGLELDLVAPSTVFSDGNSMSNPVHFRLNPTVSIRFSRFNEDGAWALRLGIPYDSLYHWGASIGVRLQMSGVSSIGEPL